MEMEPVEYKSFKFVDRYLPVKECTPGSRIDTHRKKKPQCSKVTKQNCVTKWEVLPSGQKVISFISDSLKILYFP